MEAKITITLSLFNVDQFIGKTLDSLCNQTYTNLEIICIDDASTDATLDIIKQYQKKDNRIQIIAKQKNEGLAVARNTSLELATGKYVLFLDGDDIYDLTMVEQAVALAEQNQSDMVLWDYLVFYHEDEIPSKKIEDSKLSFFDGDDKIKLLQRPAFTWTKLIKTSFAKQLNIHFPIGLTRQDIPVHWHLITQTEHLSILPKRLSYYRQQNEATTAQKNQKLTHIAHVMDLVEKYLKENALYAQYKNEFLRQQLNLLFGMYDGIDNKHKNEALQLVIERLNQDQIDYIYSKASMRYQARWFYKGQLGNVCSSFLFNLWANIRELYRKLK